MLHASLSGPVGGQLVVVCHGVTDSAASLADLIARLNPTYRVAAIDHLGHGLSPRLTDAERQDPLGSALAALAETITHLTDLYGPAIGIGHSMGGALLTRLGELSPALFRGIIAEDPSWLDSSAAQRYANWGPGTLAYLSTLAADPLAVLAENVRLYPSWPDRERLAWLQAKLDVDPGFVEGNTVGFLDPWSTWAPNLSVPTLIVTSDGEDVVIGERGCALVEDMGNPAVTTLMIPGTPHCVRRHDATAFDLAIAPYLKEWSRA